MASERPSSSQSIRSYRSDASTLLDANVNKELEKGNPGPELLCPKSTRLVQPWREALKAERDSGTNPLLNWTPNSVDFGEKPWLKIDWSKVEGTGPGGIRSKSPDQMCGYSVGNLKLQ